MMFSLFLFLFIAAEANVIQPKFDVTTDVELTLYTRQNPLVGQILINGDESILSASDFNPAHLTKFLIHGWNGRPQNSDFTAAFLEVSEANVIMVDWTKGATGPEPPVLANAPVVGRFLATFINFLNANGLPFENVHIVGVSLGSHVAGFAGRNCNQVPEYITACDPSRTSWEDNDERINPGDAKYVEIIHSNTASHGLIQPTGHADFYPNGGANMPGCPDVNCSHLRAIQYFIDSIDHDRFQSIECTNYEELASGNCANLSQTHMGGATPKYINGVYYLETNAEKPFYKG